MTHQISMEHMPMYGEHKVELGEHMMLIVEIGYSLSKMQDEAQPHMNHRTLNMVQKEKS